MDRKKQDAPGPYLEHVTLTTGDSRRSPRAEVAADVLQALGPVLVEALESGEAVDVCGTGWYLSACEDAGKLKFRLHVERSGQRGRSESGAGIEARVRWNGDPGRLSALHPDGAGARIPALDGSDPDGLPLPCPASSTPGGGRKTNRWSLSTVAPSRVYSPRIAGENLYSFRYA